MDQNNRDFLKSFGMFMLAVCAVFALVFVAPVLYLKSRQDRFKSRQDRYDSCIDVGGTVSECYRLTNPSAWRERHEREEHLRKQLEALRKK